MKQGLFEIVENKALTESVYKMVLQGDVSAITASGQFVNLKLDGLYLRRRKRQPQALPANRYSECSGVFLPFP